MSLLTILTSTTLGVLLLALAFNTATATAALSPISISDVPLPMPNVTGGPVAEIQCYALPYDATSTVSYLLNHWTFACTAIGKVRL